MTSFIPAVGLRNSHLQSILSSTGPRKILEKFRSKVLIKKSQEHIINTPQGVKLLGSLTLFNQAYKENEKQNSKGIAIIIHGWEGCSDSLYVLSSGQKLLDEGYDIFRLNLRDHGPSHHLNKALFNSSRLEEVAESVKYICQQFGGEHNLLCGYSLGGNFCLRVANIAKQQQIQIHQVIAISPLLHPHSTMFELNNGLPIYEKYFVKKWKRSLNKKLKLHPEFDYAEKLKTLKSLDEMNEYFVLNQTEYTSTASYFDAYSILGDGLKDLSIPATIITAKDDPMIPSIQLNDLYHSQWLTIDIQKYGGHCAFIKNWKFESWVSEYIVELANTFREKVISSKPA
ncbi:YheT family hydrolase [Psychromonas sp. KJ10-10]|uniref:YheT family hydrolase n=1 Tax=Psychromonas sp. KJ10-10 TaxID=3391823 RepID=UPI0039B6188A